MKPRFGFLTPLEILEKDAWEEEQQQQQGKKVKDLGGKKGSPHAEPVWENLDKGRKAPPWQPPQN